MKFLEFVEKAFSDNSVPSASRIIAGWLSISSMALIWYIVRHAMAMPVESAQPWIGGLPYIIGALAGFTVSPYGVNTLGNMFAKTPPQLPVAASLAPAPTALVDNDEVTNG